MIPGTDALGGFGTHVNPAFSHGYPVTDRLGADIDHVCLPAGVEMCELVHAGIMRYRPVDV